MSKLVHFEITGRDSAALASFYARQFGYSADPSPFVPDYHLLKADDGGVSDPAPLNGSTLKYGFDHEGGPR